MSTNVYFDPRPKKLKIKKTKSIIYNLHIFGLRSTIQNT